MLMQANEKNEEIPDVKIGVPAEKTAGEARIALTPDSAAQLQN